MDLLEYLFSNGNWKVLNGKDTFYQYFSRQNNTLYNVYNFRMEKGDSVYTRLSTIKETEGKIKWFLSNNVLELEYADSLSSRWEEISDKRVVYIYKKISDTEISLQLPDQRQNKLQKTLPLATFLVRSRFDFINGTHTVDSIPVPPRVKANQ